MKKLLIIILLWSLSAKSQTKDTVYIYKEVDTLAIISNYLKSVNYVMPQSKIYNNGYPVFVKQKGLFIGGGGGIKNIAAQQTGWDVKEIKNRECILFYFSAAYLLGRNVVGLNMGNGIVSFSYFRHIN